MTVSGPQNLVGNHDLPGLSALNLMTKLLKGFMTKVSRRIGTAGNAAWLVALYWPELAGGRART